MELAKPELPTLPGLKLLGSASSKRQSARLKLHCRELLQEEPPATTQRTSLSKRRKALPKKNFPGLHSPLGSVPAEACMLEPRPTVAPAVLAAEASATGPGPAACRLPPAALAAISAVDTADSNGDGDGGCPLLDAVKPAAALLPIWLAAAGFLMPRRFMKPMAP